MFIVDFKRTHHRSEGWYVDDGNSWATAARRNGKCMTKVATMSTRPSLWISLRWDYNCGRKMSSADIPFLGCLCFAKNIWKCWYTCLYGPAKALQPKNHKVYLHQLQLFPGLRLRHEDMPYPVLCSFFHFHSPKRFLGKNVNFFLLILKKNWSYPATQTVGKGDTSMTGILELLPRAEMENVWPR